LKRGDGYGGSAEHGVANARHPLLARTTDVLKSNVDTSRIPLAFEGSSELRLAGSLFTWFRVGNSCVYSVSPNCE